MFETSLFVGTPLGPEAVQCLVANGYLLKGGTPPPASPVVPSRPDRAIARPETSLTPRQAAVFAALTARPLNGRQVEVLATYWRAARAGEGGLTVDQVAERLSESPAGATLDAGKPARAYVVAALRSFGARLKGTLDRIPIVTGVDREGMGVGREVPSLAMMDSWLRRDGATVHLLNADGVTAVGMALGMDAEGNPSVGILGGKGDPEAYVTAAMTSHAFALVARCQLTFGGSFDEALRTMASLAGAG